MSNSDILGKADKALRPVLQEVARFPWIRLEGCCAGHRQEDNLWLEINVLGSSGLRRLLHILRILDGKLSGTDCRVDCLLSYAGPIDSPAAPHGWIPTAVEVSWPPRADWKRSQSMVIETMLSSIAEFSSRLNDNSNPPCAINYCPFCSSAFIKVDAIEKSGSHRYRCGDCDMVWTMIDPVV
jgi:hypothetical protein